MRSIVVIVVVMICTAPLLVFAQSNDQRELTWEAIKANKKLLVSTNMQLADEQKEAFWSLCDEYQAGLRPLHERTVILIEDYAKNFYSLTDDQAKSMLDEALDIDGDRVALKKAFVKNARGKLPAKTVARYIQLENKFEAVVAYEMARQIPLVR